MVGLSKHVETQVSWPIGSFVKSKAQSSVFLEFQSDRAGFCFFINDGIRPEGAHSAFASSLAAGTVGGLESGYYVFWPVYFTPDLASEIKPDQFHYVRFHEDPIYLPWAMDFIEKRMIACVELWTNANPLALPRSPSQMVTPNHT